jgi:hypothetical protein
MIKRCSLHPFRNYHSDDDLSFGNHKRSPSDHQRSDHHNWFSATLSRSGQAMHDHHHGLVRFQVTDRKLVKHTTEMIL